ncbi:MAG TPA: cobyrinate a,c-diamide synthase, partial [Steroidobacteraceae bacterium]|nr:cobyrinate a,c-diamide synthase [Steroidobacteraceae bacterium]
AGASSNVGKTTVTAGLIAALRERDLIVQPFKCGPDYVDPSYHERAAGRPCRNLDTWMLSDTQLLDSFARACQDADIAVVEGVMGLYDGSDWHDERGSTAQIAKLLAAPVLLVLDISGSARSAAAVALGYQSFDHAVAIRGVVLNFAGSERHAQGCAEAIASATALPMLGWLPRELQLRIPERHLGLVPGGEQVDSNALIAEMAAAVSARFDVAGIVDAARQAAFGAQGGDGGRAAGADGVREIASATLPTATAARSRRALHPIIAVARDEAFCFYYPENLELLIEEGAKIEFFSPLRGERPAANAAGVYLGGGYPELHGPVLTSNTGLWSALKDLHAADAPIYAECGGFMVLTEALTDSDGHRWPMAGLLPGFARMSGKLAALGYRHATALGSNLLAEPGDSLRGHEFRYSSWVRDANVADDTAAWQVRGTRGDAPIDAVGYARGNLLASYLHVHFGQRRELATRFVERLKQAV